MIVFRILLLAVVCAALQYFYPWWTMPIAAFVSGFGFGQKGFKSFVTGLIGVGLLWFGYAFFLDVINESILSTRIADLLSLGNLSGSSGIPKNILLITVTALLGGFIAGMSALSGSYLRSIFKKKP